MNSKTVTLKRTVTIKAVVTEDFKKYLAYELQQSTNTANERMAKIEAEAKQMIEALKTQKGAEQRIAQVQQRYQNEQRQYQNSVGELKRRMEQVKALQLGSYFTQGTVDGWVNIKIGDNLYQKLGGMELIIKDGIVQNILPAGASAEE